ncbi:MAG: ASCH domain-containing protein [Rhodospirillales bacterium]|nr:ASCH domain-containing protein [Rhodospirillales bacterium]
MQDWRVVTLTQPWATLVAIGAKRIETRSWETLYRGPLLIHAGAGLAPVGGMRGLVELIGRPDFQRVLAPAAHGGGYWQDIEDAARALPRGAIVARCELVDCVLTWPHWAAVEPWFTATRGEQYWHVPPAAGSDERAFGDYTPGRHAWLLADARPLATPIPARGQLGLWRWRGEVVYG